MTQSNPNLSNRDSRWIVCRQDDHGNVFEVQRGLSHKEALELAAKLTSHGHKQLYWITSEETPAPQTRNS